MRREGCQGWVNGGDGCGGDEWIDEVVLAVSTLQVAACPAISSSSMTFDVIF